MIMAFLLSLRSLLILTLNQIIGSYSPQLAALFNFKETTLCLAAMKVYQDLWLEQNQELL